MLAKPFDQIAWVEYATVFAAPADNDKCHLLLRKLTQRARVLGRGVDHATRYIDGLEHALDPLPVNARACEGRNAGGDLDAPLIDVASLGLHLSEGIRITAAGLRDRMKRSVQPPPFALDFAFKGAKAGDKVTVSWVDNRGDKRTDEAAAVKRVEGMLTKKAA